MKKLFCILIVSAMAAVAAAGLSGCFLLPKYNDPASMEIEGEVYVTGFYDNLWPSGITVGEDEPAAFESRYHNWWKVENAPYDMYCAQNKEALYWTPAVYCKEGEFAEVEAYYSDPENYNYYIGRPLTDDADVLLGGEDEVYAERAIAFIMELDGTFGVGGIFDPLEDRKVVFNVEWFDWDRVTIYRTSKDGFFTTLHMELAVYNGGLYSPYDEQNGQTTFYRFDEDVSEHMVGLFRKYGILQSE